MTDAMRETLAVLLPLIVLVGGGVLVLLGGTFAPLTARALAVVSLAVQGTAALFLSRLSPFFGEYLDRRLTLDSAGVAGAAFLLAVSALVTILSIPYVEKKKEGAEFYALLLLATAGGVSMLWTRDLVVLFLGLEIMTLSSFVLSGFDRESRASTEASLKFFLNGAFSAAFFLYGIALFYGVTGSFHINDIVQVVNVVRPGEATLLWIGGAFVVAGLVFKMAAVPFHGWSPDVYQGSPTPVTAFLSAGSKGAAALVLLAFLKNAFAGRGGLSEALTLIAVLTMIFGNLAAIAQTHLKRMLAYSSIAHAGYMLVGIRAMDAWSAPALYTYVAAYAAMSIGAFAAAFAFEREHGGGLNDVAMEDLRGMGYKRPFASAALALFMFSLAGIPPTVGFVAKLYVFGAALRQGLVGLVVVAVLASLVSLYYYLRVVVRLYMSGDETSVEAPDIPVSTLIVLAVCAAAVLYFGIFPLRLLDWAAGAG